MRGEDLVRRLDRVRAKLQRLRAGVPKFNVGDGAAAFVTMIVGGIVMILVIVVQLAADPPWWVHVLLWIPVTTFGVIGALRVAKAALLWSEFRQKAGEAGRQ